MNASPQHSAGFSLLEVTVVLLVLCVVLMAVRPRSWEVDGMQALAFAHELQIASRYAQQYAWHSGCEVSMSIHPGGYQLSLADDCNSQALSDPVRMDGDYASAESPVPLMAQQLRFGADGRVYDSSDTVADFSIQVAETTVTVYGHTALSHLQP